MSDALLTVESLTVQYNLSGKMHAAVEDVSMTVESGQIVTLVGESGSGKSTVAMALARLNEEPGTLISGTVRFAGSDVLLADRPTLRSLRGKGMAMVFQDAAAALNPCETIGDQIAESVAMQSRIKWKATHRRAIGLLEEVGMPEPERRARLYPHQLSGGQRQRAMIALSLGCDPQLLIADEPTTALDVTIQAQILALLKRLASRRGMAMLLITHDLGVVAAMAARVLVMYAGRIVEEGPATQILSAPRHPYTRNLIDAAEPSAEGQLTAIPGAPPRLDMRPPGCAYAPRCQNATNRCRAERPRLTRIGRGSVACFFPQSAAAVP